MRYTTALVGVLLGVIVLVQCQSNSEPKSPKKTIPAQAYWNLGDSAQYVGMDQCKVCHSQIHSTFIHTGMGKSMGVATKKKSSGNFEGHPVVFDSLSNLSYAPQWKGDDLWISEFRLDGDDTTHVWRQSIDYVIGSGQHTNSHLFQINGYVYQAPLTFYTQDGKWDLPPGYENGANSRFSRIIGLECMSCHNAMPTEFQLGSENAFTQIPNGINCERCHGPGNLHIKKITSGNITDTSKHIDYSIVNPKKLSNELQFQICQRCHLQGNAVLAPGKSFFDFRPGMMLSEVMDVYLPRYTDSEESFIMASHVDRLKQSPCFIKSDGELTCVTCHNPHVSVEKTGRDQYNQSCRSCHSQSSKQHTQTESFSEENSDCSGCHMPSSSSIDIPHVSVHDHSIQVPREKTASESVREFISLVSVNNKNPSPRSRWIAYMQQYEKFGGELYLLDSAEVLSKNLDREIYFQEWIQLKYLRRDYQELYQWIQTKSTEDWLVRLSLESWDNQHAWTAYRIGECIKELGDSKSSLLYFERAVDLAPKHPDFRLQYGTALLSAGNPEKGLLELETVLKMNPNQEVALTNVGYVYLSLGETEKAYVYLDKAVRVNPDYLQGGINLAAYYLYIGQGDKAQEILHEVLQKDPENPQVIKALEYIKSAS